MAITAQLVKQGSDNPNQIYVLSTTGSIFRKVRINHASEDSSGMCEKLTGQKLRLHLWEFVRNVPAFTKEQIDVLHDEAISMDLSFSALKFAEEQDADVQFMESIKDSHPAEHKAIEAIYDTGELPF